MAVLILILNANIDFISGPKSVRGAQPFEAPVNSVSSVMVWRVSTAPWIVLGRVEVVIVPHPTQQPQAARCGGHLPPVPSEAMLR